MGAEPAVALHVEPLDAGSERLAVLFDAHEARLYRLARRLVSSADAAHDLVQDTFFRAARTLGAVPEGLQNEEAWLVRVLINIRRDEWRRAKVRQRSAAALRADATTYPSTLESALMAKQAVWSALDALHPRRRALIVMHELEGMTVSAIASTMGVARVTVQWHLSMARRDLRRLLAPHMGTRR